RSFYFYAIEGDFMGKKAAKTNRVSNAKVETFTSRLAKACSVSPQNEEFKGIASRLEKAVDTRNRNNAELAKVCWQLSKNTKLSAGEVGQQIADITKISASWISRLIKAETFLKKREEFRNIQDFQRIVFISRIPGAKDKTKLKDDGTLVGRHINVRTCARKDLETLVRTTRKGNKPVDRLVSFVTKVETFAAGLKKGDMHFARRDEIVDAVKRLQFLLSSKDATIGDGMVNLAPLTSKHASSSTSAVEAT
ncbi:hypothetical protein WDW86_16690, partial [Bdellovibrionota bacterium FG-2]